MTTARWVLFASMGLALCVGCREKPKVEVKPPTVREDFVGLALMTLRDAGDVQQFRKAIDLINQQPELASKFKEQSLPREAEDILAKHAKLTAADVKEIRAEQLSSADAYYLEECFYFRDLVKHLGLKEMPTAEQVRWGWRWIVRQVALGEAYDERLPALYVVRRGLGSGEDRARVACALFFQANLDTALFTGKKERWLGVRSASEPQGWWLIDLAAAQEDPISAAELEKKSPNRWKDVEIQMLPDLQSFGLRMKVLEQEVRERNEPVKLYHDFAAAHARFQASPLAKTASAPTEEAPSLRARLRFIPREEGGLDTTYVMGKADRWNRLQIFTGHQLPVAWGASELIRLNLIGSGNRPTLVPPFIAEQLFGLQQTFWERWYLPPRRQLIHFQYDLATKHLSRTLQLLDDNDADLRDVGIWSKQALEAFLAAERTQEGKGKLDALWDEDRYLLHILHTDGDVSHKKEQQKSLSRIILGTTRQPLVLQTHYLGARVAEEKASLLQMRVETGGGDKEQAQSRAKAAWENAREHWESFPTASLRPNQLAKRIRSLRSQLALPSEIVRVIELLELTHDQAFLSWNARLREASVQRLLGDEPAAVKTEAALAAELASAAELAKVVEETRSALRDPNLRQRYVGRLDILLRNHQPGGAVDILRRTK